MPAELPKELAWMGGWNNAAARDVSFAACRCGGRALRAGASFLVRVRVRGRGRGRDRGRDRGRGRVKVRVRVRVR